MKLGVRVYAAKAKIECQHFPQEYAERKDVTLFVVGMKVVNLGRHVGKCPGTTSQPIQPGLFAALQAIIESLGKPKVKQFHHSIVIETDIVGFQISKHDSAGRGRKRLETTSRASNSCVALWGSPLVV